MLVDNAFSLSITRRFRCCVARRSPGRCRALPAPCRRWSSLADGLYGYAGPALSALRLPPSFLLSAESPAEDASAAGAEVRSIPDPAPGSTGGRTPMQGRLGPTNRSGETADTRRKTAGGDRETSAELPQATVGGRGRVCFEEKPAGNYLEGRHGTAILSDWSRAVSVYMSQWSTRSVGQSA